MRLFIVRAGVTLIVALGWSTLGILAGTGVDAFVSIVGRAGGSRVILDTGALGSLGGTGGASAVTDMRALGGS